MYKPNDEMLSEGKSLKREVVGRLLQKSYLSYYPRELLSLYNWERLVVDSAVESDFEFSKEWNGYTLKVPLDASTYRAIFNRLFKGVKLIETEEVKDCLDYKETSIGYEIQVTKPDEREWTLEWGEYIEIPNVQTGFKIRRIPDYQRGTFDSDRRAPRLICGDERYVIGFKPVTTGIKGQDYTVPVLMYYKEGTKEVLCKNKKEI